MGRRLAGADWTGGWPDIWGPDLRGLAAGAIAIPTAIFVGHLVRGLVTHFDDRRAGHDRGHEARERTGPQHLVLRRMNLRRIRSMGRFDDSRSASPAGVESRRSSAAVNQALTA